MSTTTYRSIKDWKCAHHFPRQYSLEKRSKHTNPYVYGYVYVFCAKTLFCCCFVCHCRQFQMYASLLFSHVNMSEIQFFHQLIFKRAYRDLNHNKSDAISNLMHHNKYFFGLYVLWFAVIVFQLLSLFLFLILKPLQWFTIASSIC